MRVRRVPEGVARVRQLHRSGAAGTRGCRSGTAAASLGCGGYQRVSFGYSGTAAASLGCGGYQRVSLGYSGTAAASLGCGGYQRVSFGYDRCIARVRRVQEGVVRVPQLHCSGAAGTRGCRS
eukprot:6764471-Pyramimonas_sp.AAC.1